MLISYTLKNYRSFAEEMTLDFRIDSSKYDNIDENPYVLKINDDYISRLCLLYGHNGSGKSNILSSLRNLTIGDIDELFDPHFSHEEEPSEFIIKFYHKKDEQYYLCSYTLKLDNKNKIIEKEIFEYDDDTIFERIKGDITKEGAVKKLHKLILNDNQSVFSFLAKSKFKDDKEISPYIHIVRSLLPMPDMNTQIHNDSESAELMIKIFSKDLQKEKLWNTYNQLLMLADVGIEKITLEQKIDETNSMDITKIEETFKKIKRKRKKTELDYMELAMLTYRLDPNSNHIIREDIKIYSLRNNIRKEFKKMESDGTKSYAIHLINILLSLAQDAVSIHDEIQGVQTEVIQMLITLFQSDRFNDVSFSSSQFICSTHDINIMNFKSALLPFFWFVEKSEHISELFSAESVEGLTVENIIETYRTHGFGARYISQAFSVPNNLRDIEVTRGTKK